MTAGIRHSDGCWLMETYLRDGAFADINGHRLKLWVSGQVQLVVPEQLQKTNGHSHCFSLLQEGSLHWGQRCMLGRRLKIGDLRGCTQWRSQSPAREEDRSWGAGKEGMTDQDRDTTQELDTTLARGVVIFFPPSGHLWHCSQKFHVAENTFFHWFHKTNNLYHITQF